MTLKTAALGLLLACLPLTLGASAPALDPCSNGGAAEAELALVLPVDGGVTTSEAQLDASSPVLLACNLGCKNNCALSNNRCVERGIFTIEQCRQIYEGCLMLCGCSV